MNDLIGREFTNAQQVFHRVSTRSDSDGICKAPFIMNSLVDPVATAPGSDTNKKAASEAASCCSFCCRSFDDYDAFVFIKIRKHHFNDFALLRRHQLADVVRLNRKFAMLVASINQHGELHATRAA